MTATDRRLAKIERMLEQILVTTDDQIDIKQASKVFNRSVSTFEQLIRDKKIPYYQEGPGKKIYVSRREMSEYFRQCRISTTEEIAKRAANYEQQPRRNRSRA